MQAIIPNLKKNSMIKDKFCKKRDCFIIFLLTNEIALELSFHAFLLEVLLMTAMIELPDLFMLSTTSQ